MPDVAPESRTFLLDKSLLGDLCSDDIQIQSRAFGELPSALTVTEISDVGLQLSSYNENGTDKVMNLEKRTIYMLGAMALETRADLVTAESVAAHLKDTLSFSPWLLLKWSIRRTKRKIKEELSSSDDLN